jgi:hypothetical protein
MITLTLLVASIGAFLGLSIVDRGKDRFFLQRLALLSSWVVLAAVFVFDKMVSY